MVQHLIFLLSVAFATKKVKEVHTMIFKMLPIYIILSFLLFFSYIGEAKENENRAGKICEYILYREEKNQFSGFT